MEEEEKESSTNSLIKNERPKSKFHAVSVTRRGFIVYEEEIVLSIPIRFFQKYNLPVIGNLETEEINYTLTDADGKTTKHVMKPEKFDVIEVRDDYYVCDSWYKPNVPQVILKSMVKSFTEK